MRFNTILVICAFLLTGLYSSPVCGFAKIYKYVDNNGKVQFTDRPTHDGYIRLIKTWKGWRPIKTNPNYRINKKKFTPLIVQASRTYGVPQELVTAVIHAESHFDPYVVSSAGAMGLMQLMPGTASRFGVFDRQNPRQNIDGGVRYLKFLIDMFDGNIQLALAAYNAGENAVKRHGYRIPPYKETQHYVSKVRQLYAKYRKESRKA